MTGFLKITKKEPECFIEVEFKDGDEIKTGIRLPDDSFTENFKKKILIKGVTEWRYKTKVVIEEEESLPKKKRKYIKKSK